MNPDLVERVRAQLGRAGTILLTTHQNPDGDGLGSEVALAAHLRRTGKDVWILNPDEVPQRYRFLDPAGEIGAFGGDDNAQRIRRCNLLVTLDNSSLHRLGTMESVIRGSGVPSLCIDHHTTTDAFWQLNVIDETACATGEMIYDLVKALGGTIDSHSAMALYTAMITDTGNFRFSKTSPRSHRIAAELLALGVEPARVYELVYEQQPEGFVRLAGITLSSFRLEAEGRLGWIALTRKQILECHAEQADTSEIVNHLFAIQGIRVCLLFKELPEGRVKISLRSKGAVDVHRIAAAYGGGGHQNASGAILLGSLDSVVARVVTDARTLFS